MANYLYNEVELPDINKVWTDKETYPYAYINGGWLYLAQSISFHKWGDGTWAVLGENILRYITGINYWKKYDSNSGVSFSITHVDWANFDILNEDGSVHLPASEPVLSTAPIVYGIIPLADYEAACNIIREKKGRFDRIKSGDMASVIDSIETEPTLQEKTVTENGEVIADEGYDGLSKVTVEVPTGGGASFNIHYGTEAPEDTSKLWVETERVPTKTIVDTEVHGNEVLKVGVNYLPAGLSAAAHATVGTKIYLFGGQKSSRTADIQVYDTVSNTIETLDVKLPTARYDMAAAAVGTKIYVIGGYDSTYLSEILEFDSEALTIRKMTSKVSAGLCTSAISYGDKVYIFGGYQDGSSTSSGSRNYIRVLDTKRDTITSLTAVLPAALYSMAIALVGSKIYLFGGRSSGMKTYERDYIQKFDIETSTSTMLTAKMPETMEEMVAGAVGTDIYVFHNGTIMKFDTTTETLTTINTAYNTSSVPNTRGIGVIGHDIYLISGSTTYANIDKFSVISELEKDVVSVDYSMSKNVFPMINGADSRLNLGVNCVHMGNDNNKAERVNAYLYRWRESHIPYYTYSCVETSGGTELSSNVECSVGDLVIACIVTRDTLTLSDGWTLISTSEINSNDTTNGQRLSFAYKNAESTTESITVTQATSQRLYINLVALGGATGFVDNGYHYKNSSVTSITVDRPSGLVLWACAAPSWSTSSPYPVWTASNNSPVLQLGTNTQSRLGTVLDQAGDETVTLNAEIDGGSTLIVGSLTIQGIDKFYDDISGYNWCLI